MPPTLLRKGFLKGHETETPINHIVRRVLDMVKTKTKVMILKATTGSGKSTVLPASLYEHFRGGIVSLQPRVFNATEIPRQIIAHYPEFTMQENIGYITGKGKKPPKSKDGAITFMTYGTFNEQIRTLTDDKICELFDIIILDEAHEMEMESIRIHYFIKTFLERCNNRDDCPIIIITSATIDASHFAQYYSTDIVIKVKGFSYEIEEHYLEYDPNNYISAVCNTIEKIHKNPDDAFRDIIVFIYGAREFMNIERELGKRQFDKPLKVFKLDRFVLERKQEAFYSLFKSSAELGVHRKVIIATNVGETGITYPYLKYVIDTGFTKLNEYNCDYDIYSFRKYPVTQFMVQQRKGRVGREQMGVFYGMYTRETYKHLKKQMNIKLYTDNIAGDILPYLRDMSLMGAKLIYAPSTYSIWRATDKLYLLGYIIPAGDNFELTDIGNLYRLFNRISIEAFKMIMAGYYWGAPITDLITVAAWTTKIQPRVKFTRHTEFSIESQCELLPIIEEIYFIEDSSMRRDDLIEIMDTRDDLMDIMMNVGLNPFENSHKAYPHYPEDYFKIMKQCIYEGYKLNVISGGHTTAGFGISHAAKTVVYHKIQLEDNGDRLIKNIVGASVMDGFINIPRDFITYGREYEKKMDITPRDYNELCITDSVPPITSNTIIYDKIASSFALYYDKKYLKNFLKQFPEEKEQIKLVLKNRPPREAEKFINRLLHK